ncbi:hypothetical protein PAECIP112173_04648 [Paenibacillus sp. JJ-100]|nr:hypothetical protein PAECIP112173_04648 [Paenibacillus sp. JJ-100]
MSWETGYLRIWARVTPEYTEEVLGRKMKFGHKIVTIKEDEILNK